MKQIAQTGISDVSPEDLDRIAGGMNVPTNEAQIIAGIRAKSMAPGSIFSGNSSFGDTIDNNANLP